jgi:hypothetical protein
MDAPLDARALTEPSVSLAVIECKSRRAIGSTCIMDGRPRDAGWRSVGVVSALRLGHARKPECKLRLLRYAFEKLHRIRVQLKTDQRNLRLRLAAMRGSAAIGGRPGSSVRVARGERRIGRVQAHPASLPRYQRRHRRT